MATIDLVVTASADDGDWYSTTLVNNGVSIRAGKQSTADSNIFARFDNVTVNGTITAAYISLRSASGQTNTVPLHIYAEDAADPNAPTTAADANGRALTTAYVDWTPGNWDSGVYYNSADISTIVQELVDSYSYTGSQSIIIYVKNNGAADNVNRAARSYDHDATNSPPKLHIEYTPANTPPTIALNTADDTTLYPNAVVEFTGSDVEDDDLRYQVQISDTPEFTSGVNITDSLTAGSGTPIHPNPVGSLTWEGYQQVDDRVMMGFQGEGGILDSIDFHFSAHETFPEDTDGDYLARVYAAEGHPVNPVPAAWAATTGYSVGEIARPTSTANANVHFTYRCKVGGTSDGLEPAWPGNGVAWQTVTPLGEVTDGAVTWETLPGLYPVSPATAANTPTPGWLAQSTVYAYAPGVVDVGWKTLAFTSTDRIRLENGAWYIAVLDWRPNSADSTNAIVVTNASLANATAPGNVYLDGSEAANNGPRIIEDSWFRIREESILLDKLSGTDAGFANTVTPADTDPFNAGEKISYTVQSGSELVVGVEHFWKARVTDPAGSGLWSDWATVRTFTVIATPSTSAARVPFLGGLF